jgi:hypothetical protein
VKFARFKRIGPPGMKRDGPIGDVIASAVSRARQSAAGYAPYAIDDSVRRIARASVGSLDNHSLTIL